MKHIATLLCSVRCECVCFSESDFDSCCYFYCFFFGGPYSTHLRMCMCDCLHRSKACHSIDSIECEHGRCWYALEERVCVCVRNVYIHHHTLATSSISIHTSVSRFVGICAFSIPFLDFIAKFRVRGCESFVLRLFICAPLFWGAACYSKPCTHCGICRSMAWCTSVNESASTNTITREKESKLR